MTAKNCLACDRPIKGRADKKFCDDACRNNYNNRLNSDATPLIRHINKILRRNRRILAELLSGSNNPGRFKRKDLLAKGFCFSHFTHYYTTAKPERYYYCYDYGYLEVEKDLFKVVKQFENMNPDEASPVQRVKVEKAGNPSKEVRVDPALQKLSV